MTFPRTFLPVAALSAAAACTAAVSASHPTTNVLTVADAPVCQIAVAKQGRSVNLQALVHADTDMRGSYRFSASKSGGGGRAMINQGGNFAVAAGETRTLGQATLGGSSASYDATLTIDVGGQTYTCSSDDPTTDL